MNHTTIGLDLAKNVFHALAIGHKSAEIWRKKFTRKQLALHFSNSEPTLIAMEACASSHFWARLFKSMGHKVELLPPQHVKGYLRGQKNDYNDARAIAEASQHGAIRNVPIKSIEQQDEQAFHRIRRQRVGERTRLSNQLRGLLAEYGITITKGVVNVSKAIPEILENAENHLSAKFRELLAQQYQRLVALEKELKQFDKQLKQEIKEDPVCQRLIKVPAFGPVVSSAVKNWMGNGKQFKNGREASAALGIVPRQFTSGDKPRLAGITKRGDQYVRAQIIHGARAVAVHAKKKEDPLSRWINQLIERRGFNKAVVALANKLIRIAWVIIARNESYRSMVRTQCNN